MLLYIIFFLYICSQHIFVSNFKHFAAFLLFKSGRGRGVEFFEFPTLVSDSDSVLDSNSDFDFECGQEVSQFVCFGFIYFLLMMLFFI